MVDVNQSNAIIEDLKDIISFADAHRVSQGSIWQMTVPERNNAATFLQFTTVRPFTSMGKTLKCFFCTEYYPEVSDLLQHTMTHQIEDRDVILKRFIPRGKRSILADISDLKCRLCGNRYPDLNSIRQHLEFIHNKAFLPASNGVTEYHMTMNDGLLRCHVCESKFHEFALLKTHMNIHFGKVVCEECGAGFLNQYFLLEHKEAHMSQTFQCKYCDKVFSKKGQQKYHMNIVHKGKDRVRMKSCGHCSKTFKEYYSMKSHMKKVHGIMKLHPCHICKSNFNTRRALTEHTTKYHTEKFKCEICCKCFEVESRLRQHLWVHTSAKNFLCAICNNAYKSKISLIHHLKKHKDLERTDWTLNRYSDLNTNKA